MLKQHFAKIYSKNKDEILFETYPYSFSVHHGRRFLRRGFLLLCLHIPYRLDPIRNRMDL